MADSMTDDFLDAPEPAAPASADDTITAGRARRGIATWMSTAAWLLAGVVAGALVVAMLHRSTTTNAAGLPPGTAAANQAPLGRAPGGLPGEQRLEGTLTKVAAASVTVQTATGTATYPVEPRTLLIKDGRRVPSTSAMRVGDTVEVHTYPQGGTTHTEVVIDGLPGGRGDDGSRHGFGGPDDSTDNATGTTTET